MAGLIKNQILKHLSRFTKNLSPDKLQFNTFRGHCELHNLELNEQVLTDLLELPSFLKLTRAVCNHVIVKIHWTKLKSLPVFVALDEVNIDIETCEEFSPRFSYGVASASTNGSYGYADGVVDGMTVVANSVCVEFKSPVFQASLQLTRLVLESRAPNWQKASLRACKLKNEDKTEVILFKCLEWQVLKIEAKAVESDQLPSSLKTAPLRLITNQAVCRITTKKRISDCSILGSRVVLVMDDLLWVLTDVQIFAAAHFLHFLSDLVEESKKSKVVVVPSAHSSGGLQLSNNVLSPVPTNSKIFAFCDVIESSYHFISKRIDFHLCDDDKGGRSQNPRLQDGGALQISLVNFRFDYYPYHLHSEGHEHWQGYSEPSFTKTIWVNNLLSSFKEELFSAAAQAEKLSDLPSIHSALSDKVSENRTPLLQTQHQCGLSVSEQFSQLMSSCMIIRLDQYSIFKITTSHTNHKRKQQRFFYSKNTSAALPENVKSVHVEFTHFYFPSGINLPVPPPQIFCHLGPLVLDVHQCTVFWLNAFMLNFKKCLGPLIPKQQDKPIPAIQIEALMPEIQIATRDKQDNSRDHPSGLQISACRVVATNCRTDDSHSRYHLAQCLESFGQGTLLYTREDFPWQDRDMIPVAQKFLDHAASKDQSDLFWEEKGISLSIESRDVWSIHFDPVWMDFSYEGEGRKRLLPFMDPLPLTVWMTYKTDFDHCDSTYNAEADIYSLLDVNSVVKFQSNHHQYLFLLRMFDDIIELNTQLQKDTEIIFCPAGLRTMCISFVIPLLEFSLILNTETQHIVISPSCTNSESVLPQDSQSSLDETSRVDLPSGKPTSPFNDDEDTTDFDGQASPLNSSFSQSCVLPKSCSTSVIQSISTIDKPEFNNLMVTSDSGNIRTDHMTSDSDSASVFDEDSMSTRSDLSSESEFVFLNMEPNSCEDELLKTHTEVEVASEMKEDSNATLSNSDLRNDVLSVMTVRMYCAEVVQQSFGQADASSLFQCSHVALSEYLAISWADFQNNFAARSKSVKGFTEESYGQEWQVKARLCQKEDTLGTLQVHLAHLDLNLTKSLLPLLVTTLQDDSAAMAIPTHVEVQDLKLTLQTDFPLEEESCPLTLYVPSCILEMTSKGLLQMVPISDLLKPKEKSEEENAFDQYTSVAVSSKFEIPSVACQNKATTHAHLNGYEYNEQGSSLSDEDHETTVAILHQAQEEISFLRSENESFKKQLHFLREVFAEDKLKMHLANALDDAHRLEDEKLQLNKTLALLKAELEKLEVKK